MSENSESGQFQRSRGAIKQVGILEATSGQGNAGNPHLLGDRDDRPGKPSMKMGGLQTEVYSVPWQAKQFGHKRPPIDFPPPEGVRPSHRKLHQEIGRAHV